MEEVFCLVPRDFIGEILAFLLELSKVFPRLAPMSPSDKAEATPRRMLSQVVHEKLRAGHYSRRTEEAYLGWIRRYIRFHGGRHPRELREREVVAFLEELAGPGRVSASTQNQALNALCFLYQHVLEQKLGSLGEFARARRPERLPVVLSREEAGAVLESLGCPVSITCWKSLRTSRIGFRSQQILRLIFLAIRTQFCLRDDFTGRFTFHRL